ncbi:MAG: thioredoxin family protein [Candidatus Delongbacteria bacterium]|nr:thioredoxin family protein [Candidatus Cloacimonadota bacterium]MCB9472785.1 thioredoxin family protein [Candidatus Delongbacteria bacterium]
MRKIGLLLGVLLLSMAARASDSTWMTDLDAAKTLAAKEGKYVLVDFTGSDWCGWCIKLDKEVFSKPEYMSWAEKNLIQVSLDFPRKKEQSKELKARNNALAEQFGIKGFPTILLLNPKGELVARTGYQQGGPAAYVKHLEGFISKDGGASKSIKG